MQNFTLQTLNPNPNSLSFQDQKSDITSLSFQDQKSDITSYLSRRNCFLKISTDLTCWKDEDTASSVSLLIAMSFLPHNHFFKGPWQLVSLFCRSTLSYQSRIQIGQTLNLRSSHSSTGGSSSIYDAYTFQLRNVENIMHPFHSIW